MLLLPLVSRAEETMTLFVPSFKHLHGPLPAGPHQWPAQAETGKVSGMNSISKLARKTNHIERFNNTLRQRVSRLARETLSFSKKLANHIGAIKYFICHSNLTRAAA
jgi:hypothetical protein